jgi:sulfonate transport system permease protein
MENEAVITNAAAPLTREDSAQTAQKERSEVSLKIRNAFKIVSDRLTGLLIPISILLLWEMVAQLHWVRPVFLPAPTLIFKTFINLCKGDAFLGDIWFSVHTVFRGYLWGLFFGLPFGTAAGMSKTVEKLFGPLLNSIRQVPPLAWLPLIVLWFGIGEIGKMVIIAKAVFFPVFLNTLQGIRTVNREYVEVARVYEFSRYQLIRRVIFPGALPSIFVGLRFGAGLAWVTIVAAEMLSGRKGVGYILTRGQDLLQTDEVFVVIFVIGTIGFLLDKILKDTEGRLIKWKKSFV